jgi:arylsulfatase
MGSMSDSENSRTVSIIRIGLMVLAVSTSFSLIDSLAIYGPYSFVTMLEETEGSAGLLVFQLLSLAGLLIVTSLVYVVSNGRLLGRQGFPRAMLSLSIFALLAYLIQTEYVQETLFEIQNGLPKTVITIVVIWALTVVVLLCRRFLDHGGQARRPFVLTNEHLVLAMPLAMAIALAIISRTESRLAYIQWHQPVFVSVGFAFLALTFFPVRKRWPMIGKSVLLVAAYFGIVFAPAASHHWHFPGKAQAEKPVAAPNHVLLVTVDTLRSDALSYLGATEHQTPNIDAFAAQSVAFTQAYSPSSWTLPSVTSILSSLSPLTHQVRRDGRFDDRLETIGDLFGDHGYRTGAIVSNSLLTPRTYDGNRSFHHYKAFPNGRPKEVSLGLRLLWRMFPDRWREQATTTDLADLTIEWYDQHGDEPTFLWLHIFDPHTPYSPPARYLQPGSVTAWSSDAGVPMVQAIEQSTGFPSATPEEQQMIRSLYLAEVRYLDDELGRVLNALKDYELFDDMLIVFASDHGEELWEHGQFRHGHTMYNELLHVPFLIKRPAQVAGVMVEAPVSTMDIPPTVAEICGLTVDEDKWDGRSLRGFWDAADTGPAPIPIISAFSLVKGERRSIIFDGYKYIVNISSGEEEAYALDSDPKELLNILEEKPETVDQLKAALSDALEASIAQRDRLGFRQMRGKLVDRTRPANDAYEEKLPPETIEALEALGYLDAVD